MANSTELFVALDPGEKAVKQALPENPLKVAKSLLSLITKARRGYRNQQGQNQGFTPRNNNLDIYSTEINRVGWRWDEKQ